jgi:hypothetical protein
MSYLFAPVTITVKVVFLSFPCGATSIETQVNFSCREFNPTESADLEVLKTSYDIQRCGCEVARPLYRLPDSPFIFYCSGIQDIQCTARDTVEVATCKGAVRRPSRDGAYPWTCIQYGSCYTSDRAYRTPG